jgi:type I restriction enzyme S subunit
VYSKLKAFEGSIAVVPQEADGLFASPEFPTLSLRDDVLSEYLEVLFRYPPLWEALAAGSKGMGGRRERLSPGDLLKVQIPLPSVKIQRRIVDLLSAADRAVDTAREEHLAAQRLREHLLIDGMRSLSADPRVRAVKLGDVASTQLGKMLNSASQTGSGARPYLRAANIPDWGMVDTADLRTMDFSDDELEKFSVRPGDLLVTEGGAAGRCAVYRGENAMCFQNAIHRVRANTNTTSNAFLALVLEHLSITGQLDRYCSTTTIKHLSASSLKSVEFQLPAPADQLGLVQSVGACAAKVAALRAQRERASQLRDQLLHDLLSGAHTIPESYDSLLAKATS